MHLRPIADQTNGKYRNAHFFGDWFINTDHFPNIASADLSCFINWTASSEFGTYRLCEQRRFRRACASAQSRQNLRCSLIQAVSQEEPSDWKPDPWPLWMAGHAQLKFVMTECSKTQIRLTGLNCFRNSVSLICCQVWMKQRKERSIIPPNYCIQDQIDRYVYNLKTKYFRQDSKINGNFFFWYKL